MKVGTRHLFSYLWYLHYHFSLFSKLNATQNSYKNFKKFMNSEMSNWPKPDQISDCFSSKSLLQDFVRSSLGLLGIMFFSRISLLFFKPFFCNLRWCRLPALQCRCFRGKHLTEKISWEVYTWKLFTTNNEYLVGCEAFSLFLCQLRSTNSRLLSKRS